MGSACSWHVRGVHTGSLVGKLEGRSPLGRSRRSWEDNNKTRFKGRWQCWLDLSGA
jgi:hypothetical protein